MAFNLIVWNVKMKLKIATEKQMVKYWTLAQAWSDQQDWNFYRKDEFVARKGVAEYLANQDGLTVFYSFVGREYERNI